MQQTCSPPWEHNTVHNMLYQLIAVFSTDHLSTLHCTIFDWEPLTTDTPSQVQIDMCIHVHIPTYVQ